MPRFYRRCALFFALVTQALATLSTAQADTSLQTLAEQRIRGDVSGACVAIGRIQLQDDGASVQRDTGFACAKQDSPTLTERSVFEIGSISKAMLGTIVAHMALQGELDIDKPIADYFGPEVVASEANPIRIRHLLSHTSGLPRLPQLQPADLADPYVDFTDEGLQASLQSAQLASAPGEQFAYSNFGYMVLSSLVAQVAQRPLTDVYQDVLFEPLAMTSSGFSQPTVEGRQAHGETASNWNFPTDMEGVGGVRSSLSDMLNFAQLMLGLGPSELVEAMQQAQEKLYSGDDQTMGWGWMHYQHNNNNYILHGGGTGGFNAAIIAHPATQTAVVVLANGALYNTDDVQKLALHVLDDDVEPGNAHQPDLMPDDLNLQDYVGNYPLMPGFELKIFVAENSAEAASSEQTEQLMLQATGQGAAPLSYQQADVFENLQYGVELHFSRDEQGRVTALELRQYGQVLQGERKPLAE